MWLAYAETASPNRDGITTLYRNICIAGHSRIPGAAALAAQVAKQYGDERTWWVTDESELAGQRASERLSEVDLVLTVGGDGMILRGLHAATQHDIPVLGINMGRVGFMSEIDAADALEQVGWYLEGNGHIDERTMLKASVGGNGDDPVWAVNDVSVFRGGQLRVIEVAAVVDDFPLMTYRGDGVVVATATGSTGYALQLGGPVIDPASSVLLMKPIASHMSQSGGVVLDHSSTLNLTLVSDSSAQFLVDGILRLTMRRDDTVRVQRGERHAKFLRRAPRNAFWGDLSQRLGMRVSAMERDDGG